MLLCLRIQCAIYYYFVAIFFEMAVANDVLLQNPSPVPLGGVAVFTCSATTLAIVWFTTAVNRSQESDSAVGNIFRSSQLLVPAITVNNKTNITCKTFEQQKNTTQLYIYEPVDLSSESVSDGVLVFSWSPPWAPDGVQLNYTVTVTNTNTSVVTVFTTSDTNITLTRDSITSVNSSSSSSQCDQYVWSVIAVNPAGISVPANYTTAVSFVLAISQTVQVDTYISSVFITSLLSATTVLSNLPSPSLPTLSTVAIVPVWVYVVSIVVALLISGLILIVGIILLCCKQDKRTIITTCCVPNKSATRANEQEISHGVATEVLKLESKNETSSVMKANYERQKEDSEFTNKGYIINTDENVAYGLRIDLNKLPSSHDEVQYEQVDVPTADAGFTMSTNTAYSTITSLHQ